MKNIIFNSGHRSVRKQKILNVINIVVTMAFLFNMSAFQGALLAIPSQANAKTVPASETNNVTDNAKNLDPASATEDTTVIGYASLSLNKTDSPDPVLAGSNITYTLSGSVEGNLTAQNVVLEDSIPNHTTYVSLTGPGTYNSGTHTVTWNFGNRQPGPIDPVQLIVQTDPYQQNGDTIYNTATIDADNTDPTEAVANTAVITDCHLTFTKQVSATQAKPGDTLTYTLSYENIGNSVCSGSGALVYDDLNDNLTYINQSFDAHEYNGNGDGITYLGGFNGTDPLANAWTIIPGESGVITFDAQINDRLNCGITNIPNQARIWSYQAGDVLSNRVNTDVNIPCSLTVIKHVNGGSAQSSDWTMDITGPENHSFPGAENPGTTTNLSNTGNYNVAESDGPGGYTLTYSGDCNNDGNVTINYGDKKTCTLTNTINIGTGSLIVTKYVDSGTATPDQFSFTIVGYGTLTPEQGEDFVIFNNLPRGAYDVTESGPNGYHQVPAPYDCNDIMVVPEEQSKCSFHNSRDTGYITVIKHVVGGTAVASEWTMNINEITADVTEISFPGSETGTTNELFTGSYIINESNGPEGYALTYSGDCDANGNITLGKWQEKTCTLTNTFNAGTIIVHKNVLGPDGETNVSDNHNFTVQLNGSNAQTINEVTPYTYSDVPAGQHSIAELTDPSYDFVKFTNMEGEEITMPITVNNDETTDVLVVNKQKYGTVSGYKWNDLNGNGVWDENETGLPNWTINLLSAGESGPGGIINTTTTNENGLYQFNSLPLTGYYLSEVGQTDWNRTYPVENGGIIGPIIISSGTVSENNNFGNQFQANSSITLTKSVTPTEGSNVLNYQLVYQNTGNITLTNVQIIDDYPQNYITITNPGTATNNGDTLTWAIGTLLPGTGGTLNYTATINVNTPPDTTIINTAVITSDQTAPVSALANTQTPAQPIPEIPILSIVKSVSVDTVTAGDNLTYSLAWAVSGTGNATDIVITDPLPANTTIVSASLNGIYNFATNTVTWNLGTKSPNDSGTVTLTVATDLTTADQTEIVNTATIDSAETVPVSDSATAMVTAPTAPNLQITKSVNDSTVNPGDTVVYTVVITNIGDAAANNLTLTDTMPVNLSFVSGGGNAKTDDLGNLAAGNSVTKTYDVLVASDSAIGTFINTATAQADNHPPVSTQADLHVVLPTVLGDETSPDLAIVKTVNVNFANPGNIVEYTVTITNNGDGDATNVTLTDQLPSGFTFNESAATLKTWQLGDIAPNEIKTITYSVKIGDSVTAGIYNNSARATADNNDDVTTHASLEIRTVAVLGASLEETGTGWMDYLAYAIGIGLLFSGIAMFLNKENRVKAK